MDTLNFQRKRQTWFRSQPPGTLDPRDWITGPEHRLRDFLVTCFQELGTPNVISMDENDHDLAALIWTRDASRRRWGDVGDLWEMADYVGSNWELEVVDDAPDPWLLMIRICRPLC